VKGMLEQLRQEHLPRARLQCSLLTMPAAVAKAHDLATGALVPADEAAFGKLVRDAVKAKGVLQNLPEVIAATLEPFVVEPADKAKQAPPVGDQTLRLRGEMVPVGPGEVVVGMQLVRGALPDDRTQVPRDALLHHAFRLEAGKAVMAVVVAGEQATVLFVRCTEVASDAPKEAEAGR